MDTRGVAEATTRCRPRGVGKCAGKANARRCKRFFSDASHNTTAFICAPSLLSRLIITVPYSAMATVSYPYLFIESLVLVHSN